MRVNWIIAKCNTATAGDGIKLMQFVGTEDEAKEQLVSLAIEDASANQDDFDYGTENASEVQRDVFGNLYAYGCYSDYHIDYSARILGEIPFCD